MADGPYRILVTGSRDWSDGLAVAAALGDAVPGRARDVVVVHGMCDPRRPGTGQVVPWAEAENLPLADQLRLASADWLADRWAVMHGAGHERHPADWDRYGRGAGPRRNAEMTALGASVCLCFLTPCADSRCIRPRPHDSHGASHCAGLARTAGIPVRLFRAHLPS